MTGTNGSPKSAPDVEASKLLLYVRLAVAIWGGLLALGALLYGVNPETGEVTFSVNPWRGLVVAACVAGFLGGWSLLLNRKNRERR